MNVWFVRSNALPSHIYPGTPNYVLGEPTEKKVNYLEKCLSDGFARIGWPNTGDLLHDGANRLAVNGYAFEDLKPYEQGYMRGFASILTGDLIVMPAYTQMFEVYIGMVVHRDRKTREVISRVPELSAYYYFHDIEHGEWYECSHRVDVLWSDKTHYIVDLGGVWRKAFSPVSKARDAVIEAAG